MHLMNLIDNAFGKVFCQSNINISFSVIKNKEVCSVKITRSDEPLYLNYPNKHGQKIEKFFIRKGNATEAIDKHSDITKYISKRFYGPSHRK